jgi:hypothetical protein
MPDLYVAVYLASAHQRQPVDVSSTAAAFFSALPKSDFPYDIGDDPAFFSARHHKAAVTWGVCRPDIRNKIRPNDIVAFISAMHDEMSTHYSFVAALVVAEKMAATEAVRGHFREYLNVLVRPSGRGWEHHEPGRHPSLWHQDWLWRICDRRRVNKTTAIEGGQRHAAGTALPVRVAANYVVFSRESSLVLAQPVPVAVCPRGDIYETWHPDARRRIKRLLFDSSSRGLRIANRQRPHRHFRRQVGRGWIDQLAAALRRNAPRRSSGLYGTKARPTFRRRC